MSDKLIRKRIPDVSESVEPTQPVYQQKPAASQQSYQQPAQPTVSVPKDEKIMFDDAVNDRMKEAIKYVMRKTRGKEFEIREDDYKLYFLILDVEPSRRASDQNFVFQEISAKDAVPARFLDYAIKDGLSKSFETNGKIDKEKIKAFVSGLPHYEIIGKGNLLNPPHFMAESITLGMGTKGRALASVVIMNNGITNPLYDQGLNSSDYKTYRGVNDMMLDVKTLLTVAEKYGVDQKDAFDAMKDFEKVKKKYVEEWGM